MGTLTINGEEKIFTKRTETVLRDLIIADVNDPQIALTCTSGIDNMNGLVNLMELLLLLTKILNIGM